jgi:hypothetical protein
VTEFGDSSEVFSTPDGDASFVECGQVGPQRRPLEVGLCPPGPGLLLHWVRQSSKENRNLKEQKFLKMFKSDQKRTNFKHFKEDRRVNQSQF